MARCCYNSLRLDEGQSTTHQRRTYHYSCYKSTTTPLLQPVNTSAKMNKDRKCVNLQSKAKMTYDNKTKKEQTTQSVQHTGNRNGSNYVRFL